ncbi:MAG: HDIG domain-containing protein [Candidatus Tectomicrobia bacterium]|uniref:HDIG domain-containing protein n=1 Tax=Tectimicrobiota bacterium TaxID=2528274 RepID=A0A932LYZ9_UNCTE|nr:HDIG domain-containing protein [Candidatus Tectomicrobia bacterium]
MEADKNLRNKSSVPKKKTLSSSIPATLWMNKNQMYRWLLGLGTVLLLTFLLAPTIELPSTPLGVGGIAPRDFKAPESFLVEDVASTLTRRQEAMRGVRSVYDFDSTLAPEIVERLKAAFAAANRRGGSDRQFEETLGVSLPEETRDLLRKQGFNARIGDLAATLVQRVMAPGVAAGGEITETDRQKGIVLREVSANTESVMADPGTLVDVNRIRPVIDRALRGVVPASERHLRPVVTALGAAVIEPNVSLNRRETEQRKTAAYQGVKPVYLQVQKGEMIVREGEKISAEQLSKLNALNSFRKKGGGIFGVIGLNILIILLIYIIWRYVEKFKPKLATHFPTLVLLSLILVGNLALVKISLLMAGALARSVSYIEMSSYFYAFPYTAGAMVIVILFSADVGVVYSLISALLIGIMMREGWSYPLVALIGGLVATSRVGEYKKRSAITETGLLVGLANIVTIVALNLISGELWSAKAFFEIVLGFLGGVLAAMVVSVALPIVESVFGMTSDIKLLELADLNHPLLRRLAVQAPGTYHHSIMVGNLAEEAASAIGANALLARVGSYYHDIGKANRPEYFVENQAGAKNKHDKLSPSMSSLVLISHVKEGIEMARQSKLPRKIIDIIPQHHGTGLIGYFYNKAKEKEDPEHGLVKEEDYRYPGPKPQSKEAAIVLLADPVEAASRALVDPTPARIRGLVQRIVNSRFVDGQMDECDLTLRDLHLIAKSFVRILTGIFHQRLSYPATEERGSGDEEHYNGNGASGRKPAKEGEDRSAEDKEQAGEIIRRLGMSG